MSGSSLDGLDICYCSFTQKTNGWNHQILHAETIPFTPAWRETLKKAYQSKAIELAETDHRFGVWMGKKVLEFLNKHHIVKKIDLIASHGHTIFHAPQKGFTTQIGSGAALAAVTNITTISDFRSLDVAMGGQGAPLVPIGDELLFPEYGYCLNLGGYGNISFRYRGQRIAFDICPVNKAINHLASWKNMELDRDGQMGRQGKLLPSLLKKLNQLDFYQRQGPKSLGDVWLKNHFLPIIDAHKTHPVQDLLRTVYQHIAEQTAQATQHTQESTILSTGGGAYNKFLMECIQHECHHSIILPDSMLIDFKEALVFAFMGVLRYEHQVNCLASVTGAKKDSTGGIIHFV